MTEKKVSSDKFADTSTGLRRAQPDSSVQSLRQRAEEMLQWQPEELREMPPEDIQHLIHELDVHQVELELQNEELRRTQRELELSRDRYLDLYDFAPVGYFTVSETELILEANLTAATMLGLERGRLIKQPLTRFIASEDQDVYYLHRKQLFETQEPQVGELRMVRKDGSRFWARLEAAVALDREGQAVCRAAMSDITERKRAEEELKEYSERLEEMVEERTQELREAQEELLRKEKLAVLGQLAGGVGHELRNPLGAIKNAAYFLNMVLEEPDPEVKETLEILDKEVGTSERIISSLLDFARPKPPIRRKVDVNDVVQDALSRTTVPENVEVVSQLDEALPTILADPDQLAQVFGNLILNGAQAMPEGGQLVVKSEVLSREWVAVSITDSGVGIPEENLEKIFEPLFTTKAKGIGLGLALVKTLVEGHGGRIEVRSEVGKGSTFTVRLPRAG